MARRSFTPVLCLLAAPALGAGCQSKHQATAKREPLPEAPPKLVETWETGTVSVPRGGAPAVMAQGRPPLAYIADAGGTVRVADRTAGRDLATAPVPPRTLVRVDGRRGVIFGSDQLLKGPLAVDHEYVIYLENDAGANVVRRGTFRPGQPEQTAKAAAPAQNEPKAREQLETDVNAKPGGP